MRERLLKLLSERALPGTFPNEDYFAAGPRSAATRAVDATRQAALVAEMRSHRRRARHSVAA